MGQLLNKMLEELDAIERNPYINSEDKERQRMRTMGTIISDKQNDLDKLKNNIASEFIK